MISHEPNGPHDCAIELGEADQQHIAGAIEEGFTEGELLIDGPTHWHVGSNIEGYMPEGDVACFDDVDAAREYLDTEMDRAQDGLPGCEDSRANGEPCDECDSCKAFKQLWVNRDKLRNADVTGGLRLTYNDGRSLDIAHWIEAVPAADCETEPEES